MSGDRDHQDDADLPGDGDSTTVADDRRADRRIDT